MKLVVALGNPGPKYETTRHNAGWLALDYLIDEWRATGPVSQNEGEVYQASVGGEKVLLVKPQTYMNNSGKCVGPIFKFYKLKPEDLVVLHDEVDLKPMVLRMKTGGGTGGHNGIKSLDAHLGAGNTSYHRIRIGVGKPSPLNEETKHLSTADYVLQPFTDDELKAFEDLLGKVKTATELILQGEMNSAMNRFNGSSL